tara:strand:- start:53 stop:1087 length:1035 start_codon:yes stop_codon:yes gene_type:complete
MKSFLISIYFAGFAGCGMQVISGTENSQEDFYSNFQDTSTEESEQLEDPSGSTTEEDEESDEIEVEEGAEDSSAPVDEEPEVLADYFRPGPYAVTSQSNTVSVTDCSNMNYSVYSPTGVTAPPVVVLGHGFARGSDVMSGWAEHLSTWGVEVLLPTLCHYNVFFGVDHEMNGQNMKELAMLHGSSETVYAGHSAGGLAAIIAAAIDTSSAGVLGLDTTDTEGVPGVSDFIGRGYAGSVSSYAFSIMGEPSSCNSENNGLELFRMMDHYRAIKVNSADHCDFEIPTDFMCEASCEGPTALFEDEEIREVIVSLGTAAILSLANVADDGVLVWEEVALSSIAQEIE